MPASTAWCWPTRPSTARRRTKSTTSTTSVLVAIWSMVSALHAKRIAHRDLRLANLFLDAENRPWLIDFGFAELAASDQLLGTDVAELLASTAALVGPERAVAAAHVATGLEELERAMPWLQPLALSSATRHAVGGAKGLAPIRELLVDQCGVPAEEPIRLERVSGKSLFVLATIGLSAYFLVPQLADFDDVWGQAKDASVPWAGVAVAFSFLTYVAATAALLGAIPIRLRFAPGAARSAGLLVRQPGHAGQGRRLRHQHPVLPTPRRRRPPSASRPSPSTRSPAWPSTFCSRWGSCCWPAGTVARTASRSRRPAASCWPWPWRSASSVCRSSCPTAADCSSPASFPSSARAGPPSRRSAAARAGWRCCSGVRP